jgi:hypothetical protein
LDQAGVTPPGDHIAAGVESDDRGRGDRTAGGGVVAVYGASLISLKHSTDCYADFPSAIESVDVVTLVDAASGDLTLHPGVRLAIISDGGRQWQGPGRVDRKHRLSTATTATVSQRLSPYNPDRDHSDHHTADVGILSRLHGYPPKGSTFTDTARVLFFADRIRFTSSLELPWVKDTPPGA